ncbi:MAG: hypothetical protein SPC26_07270 [Lactobacillus amylovorus]|nr:hypothetical protein [Lactobacillus amylovorus]
MIKLLLIQLQRKKILQSQLTKHQLYKTEAPTDAIKQAETPATPVTVSDKDAKTPATEGDAGKSTDVEKPAVPTDTTKAATDKAQDSVATKDQTLKEEKSFLHQKE